MEGTQEGRSLFNKVDKQMIGFLGGEKEKGPTS